MNGARRLAPAAAALVLSAAALTACAAGPDPAAGTGADPAGAAAPSRRRPARLSRCARPPGRMTGPGGRSRRDGAGGTDEEVDVGRADARWRELDPGVQRALVAAGVADAVLRAVALADLTRTPRERVRGPKAAWALALAVTSSAGLLPLAWFALGRGRAGR